MRFVLAIIASVFIALFAGLVSHIVYAPRTQSPKAPEPILRMIEQANIERGRRLSKACETCHTFGKGEVSLKDGPNLWNIVGVDKASVTEFSYSEDMKEHGGKWTYEELNEYLWNPKYLIPEGSMDYIGLRRAEDRRDIIGWMRTLSENPTPFPSEKEIETEEENHSEMSESSPKR